MCSQIQNQKNFHTIKATAADQEKLNQLFAASKAFWGYDQDFMTLFMGQLYISTNCFQKTFFYFVQDSLQKTIGFFSIRPDSSDEAELAHFYLSPPFIGQGYGSKMWQLLLEKLTQHHIKKLWIWGDPNATYFYEKMGCRLSRFEKSDLEPGRYQPVFVFQTPSPLK